MGPAIGLIKVACRFALTYSLVARRDNGQAPIAIPARKGRRAARPSPICIALRPSPGSRRPQVNLNHERHRSNRLRRAGENHTKFRHPALAFPVIFLDPYSSACHKHRKRGADERLRDKQGMRLKSPTAANYVGTIRWAKR